VCRRRTFSFFHHSEEHRDFFLTCLTLKFQDVYFILRSGARYFPSHPMTARSYLTAAVLLLPFRHSRRWVRAHTPTFSLIFFRFIIPILFLLGIPFFGLDSASARAGFVIRSGVEDSKDIRGEESTRQDNRSSTPTSSRESSPVSAPQEVASSRVFSRGGFAFPHAIPGPSQPKVPPSDVDGHHGAGGSANGGSGVVHPAGLPCVVGLVGPDLITGLLARETTFPFEQLSSRLFRPPRSV
jgi:hypothetical protein